MELIDKAAVVAEIETRYDECLKRAKIIDAEYWNGKADAYRDMLVILDTLEMKEVDSTDAFIEKVCEWLKFNYVEFTDNSRLGLNINELIKDFKKDFKKSMEE